MYAVSNAYKQAMLSPVQEHDLKGTIGEESFTDADVLAGSFSISNKAMDSTDVKYGSVYVGELSMTISGNFPVTRGTWKGKVITPRIGLWTGSTFEYVPVGVFTVDEAKWSAAGIALTAYDNMVKFDREFPGRDSYNNMTAFSFLSAACSACSVTFATAQATIEAMPNGTRTLGIHLESDVKTWRDLISWIAQALGGFATINRSGALEIRNFGNATGMTFDATQRFTGAVLEDFSTHYTGVGLELIDQNSYYYLAAQVDDGETMKLGPNPLLQHYLSTQIDAMLQPILDELGSFEFTPFKASMLGDVAFDLGDVITFTDGMAQTGGDECCIMAFSYKYGRGYNAEGYGDNPALADAESKTRKYLGAVQSKVTSQSKTIEELKNSALIYLWPTGTSTDPIGDGETNEVAQWVFECAEGAEIAVMATLGFEIETTVAVDVYTDAEVTVSLKMDGVEFESLTHTYGDGEYILTVSHILTMATEGIHTLTMDLSINGGNLT